MAETDEPPRKLITFIGPSEYKPQTYTLQTARGPRTCQTPYVPEALTRILKPAQVMVLVTEDAEDATVNWSTLRGRLRDTQAKLAKVDIPVVTDVDGLWHVFARVLGSKEAPIEPGDRLIFDITHSFRYLPFIALLTIAFLRVTRQVKVEGVYYGAYDGKTTSSILNLQPLLDLLDWTTATRMFLETGHARPLATLLSQPGCASEAEACGLEDVADALRLARADEARTLAHETAVALGGMGQRQLPAAAGPFRLELLERVQRELEQLAPRAVDRNDLQQELRDELELILWNLDHGQILSAALMAREWLVSLVCWHASWRLKRDKDTGTPVLDAGTGQPIREWRTRNRRERDGAETILKHLQELAAMDEATRARELGSKKLVAQELWQAKAEYACQLGTAWKEVSVLRNNLAHSSKSDAEPPPALKDVIQQADDLRTLLRKIYAASSVSDGAA